MSSLLRTMSGFDLKGRMMRFDIAPYDVCSFCQDLSGERECAFVIHEELAAVEIDERQYERGAMLVIPRRHRESVLDIEDAEIDAVYRLARRVARAAAVAFGACGANIYQNNGRAAGQHEPHFHVHVVPRYRDSDPEKIFEQRDYPVSSMDEQRAIAAAIRAQL